MPSFTVSELIDRAKSAADMRDDFVTETEWLRWFNIERLKLESMVARCGYVLRESSQIKVGGTSIVAGVATVTDPIAILGVYRMETSGSGFRYYRLKHSDTMDGAGFIDEGQEGHADRYRVFQSASGLTSIQFWPIPTSGSYMVRLIDQPALVTTSADTVNYPIGWEEYIVLGMAKRALAKEETFNPGLVAEHDDISRHIESACWDRVMAGHKSVRNVDRVERGWSRQPDVPTRASWYLVI